MRLLGVPLFLWLLLGPHADLIAIVVLMVSGFTDWLDGVVARGKAVPGDKTMLDALAPALDALDAALAAQQSLAKALATAATVAEQGRDATTPMLARKGRASYLGERSIGHQDPGATSMALLLRAAADTLPAS